MAKSKKQSKGTKASARRKGPAKAKAGRKPVVQRRRRPDSTTRAGLLNRMALRGLDLIAAGEIVQAAIPGGPHDIDLTLENAGLISAPQRSTFRADVVSGVSERGSAIAAADVPNDAGTTLREARKAVHEKSH